jgi:hypothetical protein
MPALLNPTDAYAAVLAVLGIGVALAAWLALDHRDVCSSTACSRARGSHTVAEDLLEVIMRRYER